MVWPPGGPNASATSAQVRPAGSTTFSTSTCLRGPMLAALPPPSSTCGANLSKTSTRQPCLASSNATRAPQGAAGPRPHHHRALARSAAAAAATADAGLRPSDGHSCPPGGTAAAGGSGCPASGGAGRGRRRHGVTPQPLGVLPLPASRRATSPRSQFKRWIWSQ